MNTSHDESSRKFDHLARKSLSLTLQAFARVGQTEIAKLLGVSESTVSRIKSERLEEVVSVLAICGLKVVPQNYHGDHTEFIDAALVLAYYGVKAIRKDQRLLTESL